MKASFLIKSVLAVIAVTIVVLWLKTAIEYLALGDSIYLRDIRSTSNFSKFMYSYNQSAPPWLSFYPDYFTITWLDPLFVTAIIYIIFSIKNGSLEGAKLILAFTAICLNLLLIYTSISSYRSHFFGAEMGGIFEIPYRGIYYTIDFLLNFIVIILSRVSFRRFFGST